MSENFKSEDSLRKLYRFICFYRQLLEILHTVYSEPQINYVSDPSLEEDYIWLVTKLEHLFESPEFEKRRLPLDSPREDDVKYISSFSIPIKDLRILNKEEVNSSIYKYLTNFGNVGGFKLMETLVLQPYEKEFLEKDKPNYFLEEKEQVILIESYLHLLKYKDKVTEIRFNNFQYEIRQLKQQSITRLFQPAARIIEEFIKDIQTKDILTEDLEQAKLTFEGGAYKATILLCGGILEALLKEALQTEERQSFIDIINKAESKGIVKAITADLTHVTRIYRNTTHINTQKSIGLIKQDDAYIAIKSLNNVCNDMLNWYQRKEGF